MYFNKPELAALILLTSAVPASTCWAGTDASYPQKPVTLVVGYAAGGGADALARVLAKHMTAKLQQPVVIENRPGAASNIAAESVARAKPDGYTLYIGTRSNAIHKSMYGHFSFDLARDPAPVGLLATVPSVIVAAQHAPVGTVQDLITLARAYPRELSFASPGVGSEAHLASVLFQQATQTDLVHVPYRGGAPALVDVMAGRVDVLFISLPGALPHIRAGKVRALAVTSRLRAATIDNVPTLEEAGVPGVDSEIWFGLMAPAGTPPQVIAQLNACVNAILMDAELQRAFMEGGYVAPLQPNTPETFGRFIAEETTRWTALIREKNIKPAN
jgi:tripartite-type tricarboxylate transporter receptor subunit TctC